MFIYSLSDLGGVSIEGREGGTSASSSTRALETRAQMRANFEGYYYYYSEAIMFAVND